MKRLYLLIAPALLLLGVASPAGVWDIPSGTANAGVIISGTPAAGGECTIYEENGSAQAGTYGSGSDSYIGTINWQPSSGTESICRIVIQDTNYTGTVGVWAADGNNLGANLGTSDSCVYSNPDSTCSFASGVSVSNGTNYHITASSLVLSVSAAGGLEGASAKWDSGGVYQTFTTQDWRISIYTE